MKLNNRGIAFSTILYASLALIIVILLMLLNISKHSKKENFFYKEEIEKNLSKCVNEEIELENCYSLGNANCNKTMYQACLGITSSSEVEGLLASEYLKGLNGENIVSSTSSGLSKDPIEANKYIYKGLDTSVKNYLEYSSKLFRIVSIEPDGSLKLFYVGTDIPVLKWDDSSGKDWNASSLKQYLNNDILHSFTDISKFKSYKWNPTVVYKSQSLGDLTLAEYNSQKNGQNNSSFDLVGLLTIDEYMKSSLPVNCQNRMLTATGCTSWLSTYTGMSMNIDGDNIANNTFYFFDGKLTPLTTSQAKRINFSVVLDRNIVILSGDGTINNPFKIR